MLGKNQKRETDERIEKETNGTAGKLFYVMSVLLIVSLIVKLCYQLPVYVYALEIVGLVAGVLFFLIREMQYGILFVKEKDEALKEIHNATLTKSMMVQFWILIVGECIPLMLCAYVEALQSYFWWFTSYILVLLPVCLVILVSSLKKGWMTWGSKKQEQTGKKNFAGRVVIGALVYGVLMEAFSGFEHLYHDGLFHMEGILWIVGLGAFWGILFYFAMLALIKISEKQANKRLQDAEGEEQDVEAL